MSEPEEEEAVYVMDADDFDAMTLALEIAETQQRERRARLLAEDANDWQWCVE